MKILLHCCCGPCAIYPVQILRSKGFEITCFFHNPNIHPFKEFSKRLNTFKNFVSSEALEHRIDENYGLIEFTRKIAFKEHIRCAECYSMRLNNVGQIASDQGYDCFSTTLLYSRYQQHENITNIGKLIAKKYSVSFYYDDFRTGWQQGIDESISQGMYRQPYCGCIYSEQERYDKSLRKKKTKL